MKPLQRRRYCQKTGKCKSSCNERKTPSSMQLLQELDDINPFAKFSQPTYNRLAFRAYMYGKWLLQGLRILKCSEIIDNHGYFCKAPYLGYDYGIQKRRLNRDKIIQGIPKKCIMIPVRASIWQEKEKRRPSLRDNDKHKIASGLQTSVSHHPASSQNFERTNPFLGINTMYNEPDDKLKSEMLSIHHKFSSSSQMDVLSSELSLDTNPQYVTWSPERNVKQIFTNEELLSFEKIMGNPTLYRPMHASQECHDVYSSFSDNGADISVSPWKTDTPNLFSPIFSSSIVE